MRSPSLRINLLKIAMETPSFESFKTRLDKVLENRLWETNLYWLEGWYPVGLAHLFVTAIYYLYSANSVP